MSDWTVQDCIEAARKDPDSYGRQVYELSNKRIALSNELLALRGWLPVDDKAKAAGAVGDVLLHLDTGNDAQGNVDWVTVIGRWEGKWNGSGLTGMQPRYWSPIQPPPEHLRADHPLMKAWKAYEKTAEFANTKKWATNPEYVQGSLWAAFIQGWTMATERAAGLHESVDPASDAERINKVPGAGAMGAVIQYRDLIRN